MRYVALLRGINVLGNTAVKMQELRDCFEALGFANVKTYINSGNIAFDCKKVNETNLVKKLEVAMEKDLKKKITVMVRTQAEIESVLKHDPFAKKYETHKQMHVLFMSGPMSADNAKQLVGESNDREKFKVEGREIYALLLDGVAECRVFKRGIIERKLKTVYTGRNWRTVQKLAEL